MTRYFYDTEFIEDGKTIDLISIGIAAEDGREYYAQSVEFDPAKASEWVQEHVLGHLAACSLDWRAHSEGDRAYHESLRGIAWWEHHADCPWRTRIQIANEIALFCDPKKYGKPEFWAYYGAYDHVALAQLYGPMIGLPPQWPMYTRDIKQWCDALGNPRLPEQGKGEHNALQDAKWNKLAWELLRDLEACKHE